MIGSITKLGHKRVLEEQHGRCFACTRELDLADSGSVTLISEGKAAKAGKVVTCSALAKGLKDEPTLLMLATMAGCASGRCMANASRDPKTLLRNFPDLMARYAEGAAGLEERLATLEAQDEGPSRATG